MISIVTQEYRKGNLAVRTTVVTFLCIPIFKFRKTSTNNWLVSQLTTIKEVTKVKGFIRHETKD